MATISPRPLWPMLASLAATAVLSFVAGAMVAAWALAGAETTMAPLAAEEAGPLRLALAPAERVGAAEAALLAPEVFSATIPAVGDDGGAAAGAYTVQLGTFLRADQAEAVRRNAESLGMAATIRLTVDGRGRVWYGVQGGQYGDRLSAALAARPFDGAHAVPLPPSSAAWGRG